MSLFFMAIYAETDAKIRQNEESDMDMSKI